MSEAAIRFEQVTRTFGRTVALDRLELSVQPGEIVGLVGRNGAGKSTSLRLAQGILYPDSGDIRVLGLDPLRDGLEVRRRVSMMSEEAALYPWMTVGEILDFGAALNANWDHQVSSDLVRRLGLNTGVRIKSLSRGNRAKVGLVLAVSCRPEVLLLDDPTASLDPLARREVLEGILEGIPAKGGAVLYASHLIQDVERIADRIVALDEGRILLEGSVESLKTKVRRVEAVFERDVPAGLRIPGRIDTQVDGRWLRAVSEAPEEEIHRAIRDQGGTRIKLTSLPLEEILIACLRGENGAAVPEKQGVADA